MSTISTVVFGSLLAVCLTYAVQASVFRSSYREVVTLVGNDVTLECSISNLNETEMVFWQNGSIVLSSDRTVYQPPENKKLSIESLTYNTFNLRIRNVSIYDAGNYSCQVPARKTQYIQHLLVNVPASIEFFPEGKTVTVEEESGLSLVCKGFGRPEPRIEWIFHGRDGPEEMTDYKGRSNLTLSEIRRSKAGEYECRATNGVGGPAVHKIEVEVEYAPFLAGEVPVIHVAPGQDVSIECFFSANPDVDQVRWGHNTSELNVGRQTNVKEYHKRNDSHDVWALHIRELRPDQLGVYTCNGENRIGIVSDNVQLSPFPHDMKILSVRKHTYSGQFAMRWMVSSPLRLLDFMIAIKQLNDSFKLDWRNFSIPVSATNRISSDSHEYIFQQLVTDTNYTVLVKARNLYGYSDWSEGLTFHTSESKGTFLEPETVPLLVLIVFLLLKNWDEVIH